MKTLIVEDDFVSRLLLQKILAPYGESHIAVNGKEAIAAFEDALKSGEPYDLICLDIMMPEMDGQTALRAIRSIEENAVAMPGDGVKIIMTTALKDMDNVMAAYKGFVNAYNVKPIDRAKFLEQLRSMALIQ
jgi:two-component system, chemotaxis family, chemotaxis protein CheY